MGKGKPCIKMYNVLAMDFGASSGRGIIGRFDGERITTEEIHRFENKPVMLAGRFSWDAPALYSEILTAISKAVGSEGGIGTVGVDTWGVDYGYIDSNGHLLQNPTHYRDTRTLGIREKLFERVPWNELYGITGIQDMNFNTVYQLYADLLYSPHLIEAADKMLFMPDLFNYLLTGEMRTEYTIASTGAILDAKTRSFSSALLEKAGIPERLFAPMAKPASVLASLRDDVRALTGADASLKVVNTASHDTASAVIAVPAAGESFVYISSGTWSLLGTELKAPLITDTSRKYCFTNEGGAEDKIRFLKNIAGLWLSQESRRQWRREGREYSFDELAGMAAAAAPRRYIIDPDDERFTPPGDMPKRIADFCEETGQGRPETPGEIIRCIFDSLALRYRWSIERINEMSGEKVPYIHIVGGGTKEKDLCRLAADACGIPVYAGPTEATALGNIASQLISSGEVGNVAEARSIIRASFPMAEYEPHLEDKDAWDEAYLRFLAIVSR